MAGRIVKDDIEDLRRQADIVAVVGDYTTLKRAGRSFKGLCPFHTERTPSFTVTPDGNFFNCFGCGVSGDLYDFLMRIEGLEFPEAVEALARRSGFQLRYEQMSARERREVGERSRLVAVTAAAQAFFATQLFSDEGEVARTYLRSRGFGKAEATTFDLGYAPNRWDALSLALTKEGFPAEDLITTGLSMRNDRGGLRDRFRGRLIFPIHDPGGDVIGFGGRILPELDYGDFEPPKYLNSAETPLYKKTRVLYGVPQARSEIVRAEQVLVCEGYTDVMALNQAGFANAVATCGTAVGVEHLRMIARYTQRVVLAFDGDAAGVKAAERAWEGARELRTDGQGAALDLRVLVLPDGRDPADLVRDVGAEGLRTAVDEATPVVPFVVRHHLAGADLDSEGGRTTALRDAIEVLGREPDLDLRREWARSEVADAVGLSYDFVARTAARVGVELDTHEGVGTVDRSGARGRSLSAGANGGAGSLGSSGRGVGGGSGAGARGAGAGTARVSAPRARLERAVIRAAIQYPERLPDEWFELTPEDFGHATARTLVRTLLGAGGAGVPLQVVLDAAPDDDVRGVFRAVALEDDPETEDPEVASAVIAGRVRRLLADRLQAQEEALRETLSRLNHATNRDRLLEVQRELIALQQRRRALMAAPE